VQRVAGASTTNSSSTESIFNYLCVMSDCQWPVLQVQRLLSCLSSKQPHISVSGTLILLIYIIWRKYSVQHVVLYSFVHYFNPVVKAVFLFLWCVFSVLSSSFLAYFFGGNERVNSLKLMLFSSSFVV